MEKPAPVIWRVPPLDIMTGPDRSPRLASEDTETVPVTMVVLVWVLLPLSTTRPGPSMSRVSPPLAPVISPFKVSVPLAA